MRGLSSFPAALFTSCLLHVGILYCLSRIYISFQNPISVPIYFVDFIQEEAPAPLPPASVIEEKKEDAKINFKKKEIARVENAEAPIGRARLLPRPSTAHQEVRPTMLTPRSTGDGFGITASNKEFTDFQFTILKRLELFKKYPAPARRRGEEGRGIMKLELDRNGSLLSAELELSTGSPLLDEELLSLAKRAAPYPAVPASVVGELIALKIPVSFQLH